MWGKISYFFNKTVFIVQVPSAVCSFHSIWNVDWWQLVTRMRISFMFLVSIERIVDGLLVKLKLFSLSRSYVRWKFVDPLSDFSEHLTNIWSQVIDLNWHDFHSWPSFLAYKKLKNCIAASLSFFLIIFYRSFDANLDEVHFQIKLEIGFRK